MAEPWGAAPTAWVLDGRVMHVTRTPLVQLIGLVMAHTPLHVVLGTLRDPQDRVFLLEQIMDEDSDVDNDLLQQVADSLVLGWFGHPRWTVQEIWWRGIGLWSDIDGELSCRGVNLMDMTPQRATNTVLSLLRKWVSGNEDRADELHRDLVTEPIRVVAARAASEKMEDPVEVEAAAFDWQAAMDIMAQHQR